MYTSGKFAGTPSKVIQVQFTRKNSGVAVEEQRVAVNRAWITRACGSEMGRRAATCSKVEGGNEMGAGGAMGNGAIDEDKK